MSLKYVLSQNLLQSVTDHEPEYVHLKRDASTLCEGPHDEQELFDAHSRLCDSSAEYVAKQLDDSVANAQTTDDKDQSSSLGQQKSTRPRPGQVELEETLSDYDHRLEDLKNKLKMCLSESESQLEKAKECENVLEGMRLWLKEGVAQLDDLQVKDPKCAVIETQQQKCQVKLVFNSTSLYIGTCDGVFIRDIRFFFYIGIVRRGGFSS